MGSGMPRMTHLWCSVWIAIVTMAARCAFYNRWGQLMYTSNNFGKTAGWSPGPEEAAEGTYYYILGIARVDAELVINDVNGQTIDEGDGYKYLNGSFTIVR